MSAGSRAGSAAARADRPDAAMAREAVLHRSIAYLELLDGHDRARLLLPRLEHDAIGPVDTYTHMRQSGPARAARGAGVEDPHTPQTARLQFSRENGQLLRQDPPSSAHPSPMVPRIS